MQKFFPGELHKLLLTDDDSKDDVAPATVYQPPSTRRRAAPVAEPLTEPHVYVEVIF